MTRGLAKRVLDEGRSASAPLFDKAATRPKLAGDGEKSPSRLLKPEGARPGAGARAAGGGARPPRRRRRRPAAGALAAYGAAAAAVDDARGEGGEPDEAPAQAARSLSAARRSRATGPAAAPAGEPASAPEEAAAGGTARAPEEGMPTGRARGGARQARGGGPRAAGKDTPAAGARRGRARRTGAGGSRRTVNPAPLRGSQRAGRQSAGEGRGAPAGTRRGPGTRPRARREAGRARLRSRWGSRAALEQAARPAAPAAARGAAAGAKAAAGTGMAAGGPAAAAMASAAAALALCALLVAVVLGAGIGAADMSRRDAGGDGTALAEWALTELETGPHEGGQRYWSHCGFPGRVEWCSCFVKTGWDECGFGDSLGSPAGVGLANSWITWAKADPGKGRLIANDGSYSPAPGDIIVQGQPTGAAADSVHVGIVVSGLNERGAFRTVEGNYGDAVGSAWYFPGQLWNWAFRPAYPSAAGGALGEGVDFGAGEEAFVREWAPRIDRFYADYSVAAGATVPLAGHGEDFARSAYRHRVDPRLSPAISINESGGGRVCWYRYGAYDAWGWAAPFPSTGWADAIEFHIAGLARGYSGLTLDEIASKYAAGEAPENIAAWKAHLESYIAKM